MISVFEHLPVDAGFTCRPVDGKAYRDSLLERTTVVRLSLVHGKDIAVIRGPRPQDAAPFRADADEGYLDVYDVDGAVTDQKGIFLTTTHGDCLPLWVCDPVRGAVGVAHAGWRGTLQGVAAELVRTMTRAFGCDPAHIHAFVGPGIGACCFEVGSDVAEQFTDRLPWAEEYVLAHPGKRPHIDLKGICAQQMMMEGVYRIGISAHCSCCEPDLFWSWRRAKDKTRMLAFIEMRNE